MVGIGSAARVLLGLMFLASGVLKLRDPSWPAAARSMGAPRWSVPAVAPLEILLGAGLAAGVAEPWPQWLALAMLTVFTGALLRALRRPAADRPTCACFGRWSAKPVTAWSLGRNLVLAALALAALA